MNALQDTSVLCKLVKSIVFLVHFLKSNPIFWVYGILKYCVLKGAMCRELFIQEAVQVCDVIINKVCHCYMDHVCH